MVFKWSQIKMFNYIKSLTFVFCFKANWSEISLFDFMVANCLYAFEDSKKTLKSTMLVYFTNSKFLCEQNYMYHTIFFYQWQIPALFTSRQFSQIFSLFVQSAKNLYSTVYHIYTCMLTWCDIDWKTGHIFVLCWCV